MAVDIGTNSVRYLAAQVEDGLIRPVGRGLIITRLGENVGRSRILKPEAIERTIQALLTFRSELDGKHPSIVMATSAVRDAQNRAEFAAEVKARVGWDVTVLDGMQEAEYSFLGAVRTCTGMFEPEQRVWVVDIGGGSTEVMYGRGDGDITFGHSFQMGSVRMTEQFITGNPVPPQDLKSLKMEIERQLTEKIAVGHRERLIAVGGTATTLAAIALKLDTYDPDKVTGYQLKKERLRQIITHLAALSLAERRQVCGLQAGREDVIVAGAEILSGLLEVLEMESCVISDGDLLAGALWANFGEPAADS